MDKIIAVKDSILTELRELGCGFFMLVPRTNEEKQLVLNILENLIQISDYFTEEKYITNSLRSLKQTRVLSVGHFAFFLIPDSSTKWRIMVDTCISSSDRNHECFIEDFLRVVEENTFSNMETQLLYKKLKKGA